MAHSIQCFGQKDVLLRDFVYVVIIVLAREVILHSPGFEIFQKMAQEWNSAIGHGVGMIDLQLEEFIQTEEEKKKYLELFTAISEMARAFGADIPGAFINERLPLKSGWEMAEVDTEQILEGIKELRDLILI